MKKLIPYGKQYIDKSDLDLVVYALKQDKITTGPSVFKFEKKFVIIQKQNMRQFVIVVPQLFI